MNIGIICKYPIPYGMAATTRIFSYSKGLLECGDKVDVWSIAPNNFNANIIMKAFLMVYHIFIHSEANDLVISYSMHMK